MSQPTPPRHDYTTQCSNEQCERFEEKISVRGFYSAGRVWLDEPECDCCGMPLEILY